MKIKVVKESLKKYKSLTFEELSQVTGIDKLELEQIINEWIAKGKIKEELEKSFCNESKCSCQSGNSIFCKSKVKKYSWK